MKKASLISRIVGAGALFIILFVLPLRCYSQCYLSQGCAPVDLLNYQPNGTGQVYHGDGASNDGKGGWSTYHADVNQCLGCHYGKTDGAPYLLTGHKNTLRKFAPGVLWSGPDGSPYSTFDSFYNSGSVFDWPDQLLAIGWCNPLATQMQNGVPVLDPACRYPYYTLPNSHAPASYTPVAPTIAAGGVRNLYYLYGGWQHYGGTANPSATQFNTIFDQGFTGDLYPNGNFDCARCHATGYNFDAWGPEPTSNAGSSPARISDAHFKRQPTDGFVAPGTSGTSSWYLTGIQCERCHVAAYSYGSHPWNGNVRPTVARNEAATALCMECHRSETVVKADPANNVAGSITPANPLRAMDRGYCSDFSGSSYATCVSNASNSWVYKPFIDHEAGQAFLNSPHARFQGSMIQNAQHSSDLSVTLSGTYGSAFSENLNDPAKNQGCTGCHDPHQTTVAPLASSAKPIVAKCDSCHQLAQNILNTTIHPSGPGTPFPTGAQDDIPGACITCHMQAALGTPTSHLFRINADQNYYTFPTADQFYSEGITAIGLAPEYSPVNGTTFDNAMWLDVDLACGQCHVGGDGKTNPYGLTMPPGMPGSHAYTRAQLAYWASVMHAPDPGVPNPTFAPQPGTYTTPVSVSIADSLAGATIYYTTDGSLPSSNSPVYSSPIQVASTTTFKAMARFPGMPGSAVVVATYSINLPSAPLPQFSPLPSTYGSPVSVVLSNTAHLPMYYTLDGSTPTVMSTAYTAAIALSKNTTIKAISAGYGYVTSSVATGTYNFTAPTPTISPGSSSISGATNVTISDTASTATIYYTTNGSTPTTSSTSCTNPCSLTISTTTTLKAIASGGGYVASNVAVATYTFSAANPVFTPTGNTFTGPVTVTMTDATPGVVIYYSVTGFPTTSSPSCSSPCNILISTTTTLRAMAAGNGISQSGTTVGVYTIAVATPALSPTSGTYSTPLNVTITDATAGATIYYAINGFPTTSSPSCSSPCSFSISASATVRAMATASGLSQSNTATASYTLH